VIVDEGKDVASLFDLAFDSLGVEARDRDMVKMRFGLSGDREPHTLEEVGKAFGVTRERVRQVEMKTLRQFRKWPPPEFDVQVIEFIVLINSTAF
jgi:DNA-directed RNA polymerase sigma subunit (sigma70/sigma32)